MSELKLYRVTCVQVLDQRRKVPLDLTVMSTDVSSAIRGACFHAGYTSVSHAAAKAEMDYWDFMKVVKVSEIEDRSNNVPLPFTECAVDAAMAEIAKAAEELPPNVASAVQYWLAAERLKRPHGELKDDLDVTWLPDLVRQFQGVRTIIIE